MPAAATTAPPKIYSRISPDYVHVVSQTLPSLPSLSPEVPDLLAQDAEYFLRNVIHLAKKRMRHSRRTFLTVEDVYYADNPRDRQSNLGHLATHTPHTYHPVTSIPGLYVLHDPTVSLFDVLHTPLPPSNSPPSVHQSGIISPFSSLSAHLSPAHATHPLVIAVDTLVSAPCRVAPHVLQRTLSALCNPRNPVPLYPILAILRYVINANAKPRGDTAVLHVALRITIALAARPIFGVELFEDALIALILTCLLSPNLGRGDVYQLRELAAEALRVCLSQVADDFVGQRVCNTLAASLTDSQASLGVVFGAITGLATMGRRIFEPIVMPLIPKLISALERIMEIAFTMDPKSTHDVTSDVVMLSQAVERSIRQCNAIPPESCFDVIL